jgi:hypothetical protein
MNQTTSVRVTECRFIIVPIISCLGKKKKKRRHLDKTTRQILIASASRFVNVYVNYDRIRILNRHLANKRPTAKATNGWISCRGVLNGLNQRMQSDGGMVKRSEHWRTNQGPRNWRIRVRKSGLKLCLQKCTHVLSN